MCNSPKVFSVANLLLPAEDFAVLSPRPVLGVFGNPVAHSLSPLFQNVALDAVGIMGQYIRLLATTQAEFFEAARALSRVGFRGANVTIPYKAAALEVADETDSFAQAAGGVNTLVVRETGRLQGFNTDGYGFSQAVIETLDMPLSQVPVLILGAGGGAGRAAVAQCIAKNCPAIFLHNRTIQKAQALATTFPQCRVVETPEDALATVHLIVNATSLGLRPDDPSPINTKALSKHHAIFDMVYAPTRLVQEARSSGISATNGLTMLLHQGARSFELWFDRPAPLETMRAILMPYEKYRLFAHA